MNLIYRSINQRLSKLNKDSFSTDRVFLKKKSYPYRYEEISEETWNAIKNGENKDYFVFDTDKLLYVEFTQELANIVENGEPEPVPPTPTYVVKFYDASGVLLKTVVVDETGNAIYDGATPTKESTVQYDYNFLGWNSSSDMSEADETITDNIISDKDVYAIFKAVLRKYDVSFYNGDSLILTKQCDYGSTPVYDGVTPTKESTDTVSYTFEGWVPTISSVTGIARYDAFFTESEIPQGGGSSNRVGGTIYYINPDVSGDYKFYREDGSEITGWSTVDDLAEAYTYEKLSDNADDKFYVFDDKLATGYNNVAGLRWIYHNGSDYQYEQIFTTPSATYEIGQGKVNTRTVMTKDDGAYVTDNSNGKATIWYVCNEVNKSERGGCSDWFIPSQKELDALRTSSVAPSNWFSSNYIWTSSEDSRSLARYWYYYSSFFSSNSKDSDFICCVCVRAF